MSHSSTTFVPDAAKSGTFALGGDLTTHRMGFGAMRITGKGIWGPPKDPAEAKRVLKRAVDLGVNFIDTADAYGPEVSENLIAEALIPIPKDSLSRPRAVLPGRDPTNGCRWAGRNICGNAWN